MFDRAASSLLSPTLGFAVILVAACSDDGSSGVHGPVFGDHGTSGGNDAGASSGGTPGTASDAGGDGSTSSSSGGDGGSCIDALAVFSGSPTGAQGSIFRNGVWSTSLISGGSVSDRPAAARAGSNKPLFVTRNTNDALQSVTWTGMWSAATLVGTRITRDAPSLALVGSTSTLHLAYQDSATYIYYHGVYSGSAWDDGSEKVSVGTTDSFGPRAPSILGVGTQLVLVNGGDSQGPLVTQKRDASGWLASANVTGTNVCATTGGAACGSPPALASMSGLGVNADDIIALYIDRDTRAVSAATRRSSDGVWTARGAIRPVAPIATTDRPIALTRTSTGLVAVVSGQDGHVYVTTSSDGAAWAAPQQMTATTQPDGHVPALAAGVCGDSAVLVFTEANNVVARRLRNGTWSSAEVVTGTEGAKFAAIAPIVP